MCWRVYTYEIPDAIYCFLAVVRFPDELSRRVSLVANMVVSNMSGVGRLVARRGCKGMRRGGSSCSPSFPATVYIYIEQGSVSSFFSCVDSECTLPLCVLPTVLTASKVNTSSICGYSWHRSAASHKPSPLSPYLCACPAGAYCPSGTLATSTPWNCTAGSYCAKGSRATAPCPSGHYCSSPSSREPCPAGVGLGLGLGLGLEG